MVAGVFFPGEARGEVISVNVVEPVPAGINMSSGNEFYVSGETYVFEIEVETDDPDFTTLTDVKLIIESTADIEIQIDASDGAGGVPAGNINITNGGTATASIAGTSNNFTVTVSYTVTTTTSDIAYGTAREITANATSTTNGVTVWDLAPATHDYGIISNPEINSITLQPLPSGATIDGEEYYIATGSYIFQISVSSDFWEWADLTLLSLTFPREAGDDLVFEINPDGNPGTTTDTTSGEQANYTYQGGSNPWNYTIFITYEPSDNRLIGGDPNVDSPIPAAPLEVTAFADSSTNSRTHLPLPPTEVGIATAGITSVTLNVGFPAAAEVDTKNYYLSGVTGYTFDVGVTANGHSWACVDDVTVRLPVDADPANDILFSLNPSNIGVNTVNVTGDTPGTATANITDTSGAGEGEWNNFSVTITYDPDNPAEVPPDFRDIKATAESALFPGDLVENVQNTEYGIAVQGITNVTVNITAGADTTEIGDPLESYFLPTRTYTFEVDVTANGHSWDTITDVTLNIPIPGGPVSISINPSLLADPLTGSHTATVAGGGVATAEFTDNTGGGDAWTDFTVEFTYTPDWTITEAGVAGRNISATAESDLFTGTDVASPDVPLNYGVCSSVKVILEQDGEAADGLVNPWHGAFYITGGIVYNIASINDIAHVAAPNLVFPAGDITTIGNLSYQHSVGPDGNALIPNTGAGAELEYVITPDLLAGTGIADNGIGVFTWVVPIEIVGIPANNYVSNLTLICDKIEIIGIEFQNGGGYSGNAPEYNRNIYTSGTQIRVQTRMQYLANRPVENDAAIDADITVSYSYPDSGLRTTVLNYTGATDGGAGWSEWVEITNPTSGDAPSGTTLPFNGYEVSEITGTGGHLGGAGQNAVGRIVQDSFTPPAIYWDNADPPGSNAGMFTSWVGTSALVDSISLEWDPIAADLASAAEDADFESYRIYFKTDSSTTWNMVDETTLPALGNIDTNTYTITGLQSLTTYDYYLSVVDVFGNETLSGNRSHDGTPGDPYASVQTVAFSLDVKISDGITSYDNAHITTTVDPLNTILAHSALRVEVEIVGATQPDEINVLFGAADPSEEQEPFSKTAINKWVAHISSDYLTDGQDYVFRVETILSGTPREYPEAPDSWVFRIEDTIKTTPWPTRILNNVITRDNPRAYPAYYLTDDAHVTITVYDVKGREIAKILDNAYRPSGQNIREQGWAGTNRAGRKLGVGLYYVHIKAERASDGRVIINEFKKVVISR